MKTFIRAWVLAAALVGLLAAPAAASEPQQATIGDPGLINPSLRSQVLVPVTVNCVSNVEPRTGVTTVTLTQEYRGTTTTATGQTEVICDGVTRTYLVTVESADGEFRKGSATASATTTFNYEVCAENQYGDRYCSLWPVTMFTDPEPISLRVGR